MPRIAHDDDHDDDHDHDDDDDGDNPMALLSKLPPRTDPADASFDFVHGALPVQAQCGQRGDGEADEPSGEVRQ